MNVTGDIFLEGDRREWTDMAGGEETGYQSSSLVKCRLDLMLYVESKTQYNIGCYLKPNPNPSSETM